MSNELREQLAELAHDQWSGWMAHLFSKSVINQNGTMTIPKWAVDRWTKQVDTPYPELSVKEMDSDRTEADRFLAVFQSEITALQEKMKETKGKARLWEKRVGEAAKTVADYEEIQSQLAKHRWIPVSERLPEVKKPVWVVDYKGNVWQAELLLNQRFYSEETQHELHTADYWQEIILPEKGQDNE